MKLLFIKYDPRKDPALFLLLDDSGPNLVVLKNEKIDKAEIPLIRRMLPQLKLLALDKRIAWFKALKSWKLAFRKFAKNKITVIKEYDPKP